MKRIGAEAGWHWALGLDDDGDGDVDDGEDDDGEDDGRLTPQEVNNSSSSFIQSTVDFPDS